MRLSKLITREHLEEYVELERYLVENEQDHEDYWRNYINAECDLFEWESERIDAAILAICKLATAHNADGIIVDLPGRYLSIVRGSILDAFLTGFWMGSKRWETDYDWMEEAYSTEDTESEDDYNGDIPSDT